MSRLEQSLIKIGASLASGKPLMYLLAKCEKQKTISTNSVHIELDEIHEELKLAAIAINKQQKENTALKAELKSAKALDVNTILENVSYSHNGMACGIEDRDIVEVNEAAEYGFNECLEQIAFQINVIGTQK